jgi:hypothetical protein
MKTKILLRFFDYGSKCETLVSQNQLVLQKLLDRLSENYHRNVSDVFRNKEIQCIKKIIPD